jgi:hypothetical protein
MMIRLLGEQSDAGHEPERRHEVCEDEALGDAVALRLMLPSAKRRQQLRPLGLSQPLDHIVDSLTFASI